MFLEKSLMISSTSQDQLKPCTALNSARVVQNLLNAENILTFFDFREYFNTWNSSVKICIFQQEKAWRQCFATGWRQFHWGNFELTTWQGAKGASRGWNRTTCHFWITAWRQFYWGNFELTTWQGAKGASRGWNRTTCLFWITAWRQFYWGNFEFTDWIQEAGHKQLAIFG